MDSTLTFSKFIHFLGFDYNTIPLTSDCTNLNHSTNETVIIVIKISFNLESFFSSVLSVLIYHSNLKAEVLRN